MIPAGTDSIFEWGDAVAIKEYERAKVYGEMEAETVLHEGELRVLANGWVELPTGRLISPNAIHHVDPVASEPE